MKQVIFITISILAFCFLAFAQVNENDCQKIIIKAPEFIEADESVRIFASFEKEKQPAVSKFNWIVINADKLTRINERGIIEINSEDMKNGGTIILLAESLNKNCQNISIAKTFVVPKVGSPLIIDEYSEINWNDEKARLHAVSISMQNF